MDSRARTDVHDIVRRPHGVLVVFDDEQRVPQIAQSFEGIEKPLVIPLMQTDARLVENVQHPRERASDLRREADALTFAARQGRRAARQREIVETDADQEIDPAADLFQDHPRDRVLRGRQLQRAQKFF